MLTPVNTTNVGDTPLSNIFDSVFGLFTPVVSSPADTDGSMDSAPAPDGLGLLDSWIHNSPAFQEQRIATLEKRKTMKTYGAAFAVIIIIYLFVGDL